MLRRPLLRHVAHQPVRRGCPRLIGHWNGYVPQRVTSRRASFEYLESHRAEGRLERLGRLYLIRGLVA